MTLDDLELLAREGRAGALALAEADPADADQLASVANRFEVAENRCRLAREFIAKRAEKQPGRAALRAAPEESRAAARPYQDPQTQAPKP